MYILKFKFNILPIIIAVIASCCAAYFSSILSNINSVNLSLYVILAAIFVASGLFCTVAFKKASKFQSLILALSGVLLTAILSAVCVIISSYAGFGNTVVDQNYVVNINPIFLGTIIITSFICLKVLFRFELDAVKIVSSVKPELTKENNSLGNTGYNFSSKSEVSPVKQPIYDKPEIPEAVQEPVINNQEIKQHEPVKSEPEQNNQEIYFEDLFEVNAEQDNQVEDVKTEPDNHAFNIAKNENNSSELSFEVNTENNDKSSQNNPLPEQSDEPDFNADLPVLKEEIITDDHFKLAVNQPVAELNEIQNNDSQSNIPDTKGQNIIDLDDQTDSSLDVNTDQHNIPEEHNNNENHTGLSSDSVDSMPENTAAQNEIESVSVTESIKGTQFIPDDIRLIEDSSPVFNDSKGKISSIGKLLVNQRDIENIIDTNELMKDNSDENSRTHIVSKNTGSRINDRLTLIKTEFPQIDDLAIFDEGGFVISSLIKDMHAEQTMGAVYAGAYSALQNYLLQFNVKNPSVIFFETEKNIDTLYKLKDKIFFYSSDREFEQVNYTPMKLIIEQSSITNLDLSVIKNIKGLNEAVITDRKGHLIGSVNSDNPEKVASVSSAVFENLKVFMSKLKRSNLSKIIIFNDNKALIIKKYNDKIATFITTANIPVKLNEKSQKIYELINALNLKDPAGM